MSSPRIHGTSWAGIQLADVGIQAAIGAKAAGLAAALILQRIGAPREKALDM